jgi:hypothetical protein
VKVEGKACERADSFIDFARRSDHVCIPTISIPRFFSLRVARRPSKSIASPLSSRTPFKFHCILTVAFKTKDVLRLVHASYRTGSDAIALIEVRTSLLLRPCRHFRKFLGTVRRSCARLRTDGAELHSRDWFSFWQFLVNGFGRIIPRHQIMKQQLHKPVENSSRTCMDYEDVPQYYRDFLSYGVPYEGPPDRIRTQRCFLVRISPSRPRPPFVPTPRQVSLPAARHFPLEDVFQNLNIRKCPRQLKTNPSPRPFKSATYAVVCSLVRGYRP